MKSSYDPDDVTLLLKDITGLTEPLPAEIREARIQKGAHYCEMLPLEYKPSEQYLAAYRSALQHYAESTARATGFLAEKLYRKKGRDLVIVSLARAGIPVGILIKRYLNRKYGISCPHYAISIIRGRGIDRNAVAFILKRHDPQALQFIDGWIGKGAILTQLREALSDYPELDAELGVISDPANLTELCGTHEDILIPSSCLNATVTGLISRTFLRSDIIGPHDFHGAAFYENLRAEDLSRDYLSRIERFFDFGACPPAAGGETGRPGLETARLIAETYGVTDINFIKPGIGEATRVLLRRIPWRIIVNPRYASSPELLHIRELAREKNVPWEDSLVDLGNYKVAGIIKKLSDI